MRSDLKKQIEPLIANICNNISCELIEWESKQSSGATVINVIADRPKGGITIDECTAINKCIVAEIEKQGWFGDSFTVEVASPGLDRSLKTAKDFIRAAGRYVRIHLTEPVEGKIEHHGLIRQVDGNQVIIDQKNAAITIPLNIIAKAVQKIEYK